MRKKLFCSALLLLLFSICRADFERIYLNTLLQESQLIVVSRITKVLDNEIQIEITEQIKGDWPHRRLLVSKFESWMCAQRDTYAIGQKQIFFLRKHLDGNRFNAMGAGNEGEMIITGDSCDYNGTSFLLTDVVSGLKTYLSGKAGAGALNQKKANPFLTRIINEQ